MRRVAPLVATLALVASLAIPAALLIRSVDDPMISAIGALIAFVSLAPLFGQGRSRGHMS